MALRKFHVVLKGDLEKTRDKLN